MFSRTRRSSAPPHHAMIRGLISLTEAKILLAGARNFARSATACHTIGVRGPVPEGLPWRLYEVAVLALVITLVVWFDLPTLLWPAFIVALLVILVDRRRGIYLWTWRHRPR